jgi:pyruvate formate lyase activating enzyme
MGVEETMAAIRQDLAFYEESGGGATFTGGEPLMQPLFLGELLDACRAEGIPTAVDTSGFADSGIFMDIARRSDLILFDLKLMDEERHLAATGAPLEPILENLKTLARAHGGSHPPRLATVALRLPVITGLNDSLEDMAAAARFIAGLGLGWPAHLLPYHDGAKAKYRMWGMSYPLSDRPAPSSEHMKKALEIFRQAGVAAKIGG